MLSGYSANIENDELARTFNCGIGMTAIVDASVADRVEQKFREAGETVYRIGIIEPSPGESQDTVIAAMETAWQD